MARCPDLDIVFKNLPSVLQLLTNVSLESMAELLPEGKEADHIMVEHYQRVSQLCAQVQVDADKMNPKFNKTYGEGGTYWTGDLMDGRDRGGIPYYCPSGWVRFSLNVCPDEEFEKLYGDWGYLYHGTQGKHVGAILTSGFRASKGLCFCGAEDHAVYMSPSIEYSGHPRYGRIEYNPESKQWIQVVLQCRVNAKAVWKVCPETMHCKEFGLTVDPNVDNQSLEWLFKPNHIDADTGYRFMKDSIVCTGIMVRVSDHHPIDMGHWWSQSKQYLEKWNLVSTQVDPHQSFNRRSGWKRQPGTKRAEFIIQGNPVGADFSTRLVDTLDIGMSLKSPKPFANGSMRFAYYLHTRGGLYVVKEYNAETERHIADVLQSTPEKAIINDVNTYLVASYYANMFNEAVSQNSQDELWHVNFLEPYAFRFADGSVLFGEPFIQGKFIKWNNNAGEVNDSVEAKKAHMNEVAAAFSHFTYTASQGKLMVVDIQGWDVNGKVMFTDPQIHTRSFQRNSKGRLDDVMFRRFSIANFGKTGMTKFFMNHVCNKACRGLKLPHPIQDAMQEISETLQYEVHNLCDYLPGQSVRSEPAVVGNFKFRLLVFPQGTVNCKSHNVSAFVEAVCDGLPDGWKYPDVKFSIAIQNWKDKRLSVEKQSTCTFSAECAGLGWNEMLPLDANPGDFISVLNGMSFQATCKIKGLPKNWKFSLGKDANECDEDAEADQNADEAALFQQLFGTDVIFVVSSPESYEPGQAVRSEPRVVGNFKFGLVVYPKGTLLCNGQHVSAFVEAVPDGLHHGWSFPDVKYSITVENWKYKHLSVEKKSTWTFSAEGAGHGWNDMLPVKQLSRNSGWLNKERSLKVRASCTL